MATPRPAARWAAVALACALMGCAGAAPPRAGAPAGAGAANVTAPAIATTYGLQAITDPGTRKRCVRLCRRLRYRPLRPCVHACERIFRGTTTAPGLIGDHEPGLTPGQTGDGDTGDIDTGTAPGNTGTGDTGNSGAGDGDASGGGTETPTGTQMPSRVN